MMGVLEWRDVNRVCFTKLIKERMPPENFEI